MLETLSKSSGLDVQPDVLLKNYTTFKIGGPAKFFVKVNNQIDLLKVLQTAGNLNVPFIILGGGSNILVADQGFDGLVIKLESGEMQIIQEAIKVFSGNNWAHFVRQTISAGFGGLEFGGNIPGTVGGAMCGNAGAYGQAAGDFVESVEVIDVSQAPCALRTMLKEQCAFSYRESIFKKNKHWIIASATFHLLKDEQAMERLVQIQQEYQERCAKQPLGFPNAGSIFKNLLYSEELIRFKAWEKNGKIPAARFLEACQLKGEKIGSAMVSEQHANFIINGGEAKAEDVRQLIAVMKKAVKDKFGLQLEEEIQYLGF